MSQYAVISRERHGGKKWRRPDNYLFAAADAQVPVVMAELGSLALAMPLALVKQAGRYVLMGVLSLTPRRNMFVAADGRWLGNYVPARYRAYPFSLVQRKGTDESLLCVDEDSELVVDARGPGEDFFDADGPSQAAKKVFNFLAEIERSRKKTGVAVSALVDAGVIQPWPIKLKTAQAEQPVGGLHRIDEAALNALGDDDFLKLRKASALPVIYAQLLSTGQLMVFEHLARFQAQLERTAVSKLPDTIDSLVGMLNDDIIRFR